MENNEDAFLLSDDNIDFEVGQDVSILFPNDELIADEVAIFGDSSSSQGHESPISIDEEEGYVRKPQLSSARPFKQQRLVERQDSNRSESLILDPIERYDPEEEADKKRILNLCFRLATKQFGFVVQVQSARYLYSWLKSNGLTKKSEESKTETAIRAICDRARTKYSGSAILDFNSLSSVIKEFDATYGLTEEGEAVTGVNFNQGITESLNMLELHDQFQNDHVIDITKYFRCINAFKMPHLKYEKIF
ncbi:hypothetical protein DSO57_1014230 [Entomophthora muscae]|uniref:Uncharacterized protein n=1 Tax=Entomophthora muscae TaxID=34485 RepID=A0ACC2SUP3_9FUNG|nr:hypothetical protein DSO57_1014230 [Entomophthora muscae]